MSLVKHISDRNIVFLEQLPHLSRTRMQEIRNVVGFINSKAKYINDDIFVLDFSKLVNRP